MIEWSLIIEYYLIGFILAHLTLIPPFSTLGGFSRDDDKKLFFGITIFAWPLTILAGLSLLLLKYIDFIVDKKDKKKKKRVK